MFYNIYQLIYSFLNVIYLLRNLYTFFKEEMYIHETIFLAYGIRDFKQGQGLCWFWSVRWWCVVSCLYQFVVERCRFWYAFGCSSISMVEFFCCIYIIVFLELLF